MILCCAQAVIRSRPAADRRDSPSASERIRRVHEPPLGPVLRPQRQLADPAAHRRPALYVGEHMRLGGWIDSLGDGQLWDHRGDASLGSSATTTGYGECMSTTPALRRTAAGALVLALAATLTGCAANNGNGDSVTRNGVTSEPAGPSPNSNP